MRARKREKERKEKKKNYIEIYKYCIDKAREKERMMITFDYYSIDQIC